MTTIHTRQLQQYTQDNYYNTHETTTTIHTRQLTTIHTRHLKIQHVPKGDTTFLGAWLLAYGDVAVIFQKKEYLSCCAAKS